MRKYITIVESMTTNVADETAYPHLKKDHLCRIAYNARDQTLRGTVVTFLGFQTVPGTGTRKARVRLDGDGGELLFNPSSLIKF